MKLIVGLGNPGNDYQRTRHNMGFFYIDEYAKRNHLSFDKKKLDGIYTDFNFNDEKIILLKPQKYINLSGEVLKKFVDYFNINIDDILVICDDLDTPVGKYKLKKSGTSGGHNGLKNIQLMLGTSEYNRLKIGISNNKNIDTKDYVLSKLDSDEYGIFYSNVDDICNIIDDFYIYDMDKLMNKYNKK